MNKNFILIGFTDFCTRTAITLVLLQYANYYFNFFPLQAIAFGIVATGQFVGALAYPIGGYLGDKIETRFGKYKPFFLLSIPCAIFLILASFPWFIQPLFAGNVVGIFIFLIISVILFFFTWRISYPNFVSYFTCTSDDDERLQLSFTLNIADILSIVISLMAPLILYIWFEFYGIIFAILTILSSLLLFFYGKEEPKNIECADPAPSMFKSFSNVMKVHNYKIYIYASFFANLGYGCLTALLVPYLESFNLGITDYLITFPILITIVGLYIILFMKFFEKNDLNRLRFSLLVGGIGFPTLLILGINFYGALITFAMLLCGAVGFLIYLYTTQMRLGEQNKEMQSSYFGLLSFMTVLSPAISTYLIMGLSFLNIYSIGIWINNLGYCLAGIIGGIGFILSWILLKYIEDVEQFDRE